MVIFLFFLILLVEQLATAKIEFSEIEFGLKQCYKPNRWAIVEVTVASQYESFEGKIGLQVNEVISGQEDQSYSRPLVLQSVDRRRLSLPVYIPDYSVEIKLRLISYLGELRLVKTLDVPAAKPLDSTVILIVSPIDNYVDKPSGGTVFEFIAPNDLPTYWIAYESVDLMVLHQVRLNDRYFPPARQSAILDWICRGGTLLLSLDNDQKSHFLSPFIKTKPFLKSSKVELYSIGHGRLGVLPYDFEDMLLEFGNSFFLDYSISPRNSEVQYEPFRRHQEQIHQYLKSFKPSSSSLIRDLVIVFSFYCLLIWWGHRQTYRKYLILSILIPFLFILILIFPFTPDQISVSHFSIATVYRQTERIHLKTYLGLISKKNTEVRLKLPKYSAIRSQSQGSEAPLTQIGDKSSIQVACDPWQMKVIEAEVFLDLKRGDQKILLKDLSDGWRIVDKKATLIQSGEAEKNVIPYRQFQDEFYRTSITSTLTDRQVKYARIISKQNLLRHLFKEPNTKIIGWTTLPPELFPLKSPGRTLIEIQRQDNLVIAYP